MTYRDLIIRLLEFCDNLDREVKCVLVLRDCEGGVTRKFEHDYTISGDKIVVENKGREV